MKKTIFSKEISPKCEYCETGMAAPGGKEILCRRKGIMQPDSFCKKFIYDPLKRMPKTQKLQNDFSPEDFSL